MNLLTTTNNRLISISMLLLRLTIGVILFYAGAGKVFGWFGGMGLGTTVKAFHDYSNISAPWTYTSSFTELIGSVLLAIGLLTRPAALFVFINMAVAVYVVGPLKFFDQGGSAYPFILMIIALAILLTGPMKYSIDALIFRETKSAS
jgi:putative oxidoreductase